MQQRLPLSEETTCTVTMRYDPVVCVISDVDLLPDDIVVLKAALLAERAARLESDARASGAEAMVAHLKLMITKMRRDRFGASAERGSKLLNQLELQLEELETALAEDTAAVATPEPGPDTSSVRAFTREKPKRGPLPAHLPRERVVLPSPTGCPCCGGKLTKLGESVTETLECIPRSYRVVETVHEKFSCSTCETITQPPAPFHPIARGRAGASLLAEILYGKFCEHQPLNRQTEGFARAGLDLSVSTLADWVGACTTALSPLVSLIRHDHHCWPTHRRADRPVCAGRADQPRTVRRLPRAGTRPGSATGRHRRHGQSVQPQGPERAPDHRDGGRIAALPAALLARLQSHRKRFCQDQGVPS